jgi:hypothetical protein
VIVELSAHDIDRGRIVHRLCRPTGLADGGMRMESPEGRNYAAIERLEKLLGEVREDASTPRETEAIREIGLEIAIAIREVGAMLINVGWEQTFATTERTQRPEPPQ